MNNPLQKYFRKASVYFRLPSTDDAYPDDVLQKNPTGEHAVFAMSALDEITARTPDALYNGSAVVDIIQSCIPDIRNAWMLKTQDLDAVLTAIRIASGDGTLDITSECPACKQVAEYTANLTQMLSTLQAGNYAEPLKIDDLVIQLQSPTYQDLNTVSREQVDIQRAYEQINTIEDTDQRLKKTTELLHSMNFLTMKLLACSIAFIRTADVYVDETEYIYDFLQHCDRRVFTAIRDRATAERESSTLKPMRIQCVECQHIFDQSINMNISDFFE